MRRQKKSRQKRRLVQAPQAPFKAPIHSKCCIGGFRETGLALVIVLRCDWPLCDIWFKSYEHFKIKMRFHSCLQIMGLPAWIFAFLASKRFLTSVGKHVIFQSACPPAREAALIAGKGILSRMLQYVFLDIISLDAWIVALVTTEMPLPWMCWHVLFEVAPLCEGRGTMGAFKGLLPWISEGWVWFNPCSTVDHWYTCTLKVVPSYRVYFCQKIKKAPGKKAAPWRLLGAWAPFLTLAP